MRTIDISSVRLEAIERLFRECTPRLLVVTDGSLDDGPGAFGLSRFLATLRATTIHGMAPQVIHRRRTTNSPDDAFADVAKSRFDVVFLFGFTTTDDALSAGALDRITRFMQAGGGVFATGDHEDLGTGMCGQIPRVRAMRYWQLDETPDVRDASRLTTNLSGANRTFEFDDQADAHPQRLYANYAIPSDRLLLPPVLSFTRVRSPHPLLRMADRSALDVYPDHPHEGECRIPDDLSTTFQLDGASLPEWPGRWFAFPAPRAVASTMSFGNGFEGASGPKDAVAPRAFVAIAAYDGQVAGVGRVVTDATWHHYVNVNLVGMLVAGAPNADLQRIERFWSNLANWLMPATTRRCLWPWIVVTALRDHPLAEEIRIPIEGDLPIEELQQIGRSFVSAADARPGGSGTDLVVDVIDTLVDLGAMDPPKEDLPLAATATEVALSLIGGYVAEVARAAARDELDHEHGTFEKTVLRTAPPIVERTLEAMRAECDRRIRSIDVLQGSTRAAAREPQPEQVLATATD